MSGPIDLDALSRELNEPDVDRLIAELRAARKAMKAARVVIVHWVDARCLDAALAEYEATK